MSDAPSFDYRRLRFIETRGPDDKRPAREWGGYGQEFDTAEHVHTVEDIQKVPHGNWAIVDIDDKDHMPLSLLIFDLDIHKAPSDFDPDDVTVPEDTLLVRSQSGGLHLYFAVHGARTSLNESDFRMTEDLGWDIDIRGSAVAHHVVAPADIPGVDTPYAVVNDKPIKTVTDPADAATRIRYDDEPLIEYAPEHDRGGYSGTIDIDRDAEPPADMPTCYHRGLQLRAASPDDPNLNSHKINVLTALCGIYAGYDLETIVDHFVEDYPPDHPDRSKTNYQINHLAEKVERGRYSPPSLQSLRDYGILEEDEECSCTIPYHGNGSGDSGRLPPEEVWEWWAEKRIAGDLDQTSHVPPSALRHLAEVKGFYDFDALPDDAEELPAKAHNKALHWVKSEWPEESDLVLAEDEDVTAQRYKSRTDTPVYTWEDVRYIYADDNKQAGRKAARALLRDRYDFMTVEGTDALQLYDPATGIYTEDTSEVRGEIYTGLDEYWSTHELNEIIAGLKQMNVVPNEATDGQAAFDNPVRCLENCVLDLLERKRYDHSPDYYFTERIPVTFDPGADTQPYDEFVDELVEREEGKLALFEMVGHALMPDANERYKKFLILTGGADNGKTTFYRFVTALLNGPDGTTSNTSSVKLAKLARNRFSKNSMYGSMANIAGEIDGKKIRNTANIKDITGGDDMEIEPKGEDSFFDVINTTLMFAANDPPLLGERDKEAIATRLVPIELPYTFVDDPSGPDEKAKIPERELRERLETPEALSGFLNLALDGIQRLEANHGDVSLPEGPRERLKQYERRADPMKEFGERCLANHAGDYIVKADVTEIFTEFAIANDYELGSNVHDTLHKVLRRVRGLNYSTSRPENAHYKDTSLPLRPWDDRKHVVDRMTLTEEGLEYAEAAGLVLDGESPGVTSAEDDLPLSPADVSTDYMTPDGRLPTIEATVTGTHQGRYGNPSGRLEGPDRGIDFTIVGTERSAALADGATVRVTKAELTKGELGKLELEIDPTTEIVVVEAPPDGSEDCDNAETAADGGMDVDSGPPADAINTKAKAQQIAERFRTEGIDSADDAVTPAQVAPLFDIPPKDIEAALKTGARNHGLFERDKEAGRYWVI